MVTLDNPKKLKTLGRILLYSHLLNNWTLFKLTGKKEMIAGLPPVDKAGLYVTVQLLGKKDDAS